MDNCSASQPTPKIPYQIQVRTLTGSLKNINVTFSQKKCFGQIKRLLWDWQVV